MSNELAPGGARYVPEKYAGTLEPNHYCRAWNPRRSKYCRQRAGAGTPHKGVGRCSGHNGGADQRTKHGIYSNIRRASLRKLIEQHEKNPDPLNILPELHTARALFEDHVNRYQAFVVALLAWHRSYEKGEEEKAKPRQVLDIVDSYRLIAEITRIVARIETIRAADAISRSDLYRVMGEMGRVVETYVDDENALQEIKRAWLGIRV